MQRSRAFSVHPSAQFMPHTPFAHVRVGWRVVLNPSRTASASCLRKAPPCDSSAQRHQRFAGRTCMAARPPHRACESTRSWTDLTCSADAVALCRSFAFFPFLPSAAPPPAGLAQPLHHPPPSLHCPRCAGMLCECSIWVVLPLPALYARPAPTAVRWCVFPVNTIHSALRRHPIVPFCVFSPLLFHA